MRIVAAAVALACALLGAIACDPDPVVVQVGYGAAGVLGGSPEQQFAAADSGGMQVLRSVQQSMSGVFRTSPYANSWDKKKRVYMVLVMIRVSGGVGGPYVSLVSPQLADFHQNDDGEASGYLSVAVGAAPVLSVVSKDANGNSARISSQGPTAPDAPLKEDPPQVSITGLDHPKDPCRLSLTARFGSRADPGPFAQWWTWDKGGPAHNTQKTLVHQFGRNQHVAAIVQDQNEANLGRPLGVAEAQVCWDSTVT